MFILLRQTLNQFYLIMSTATYYQENIHQAGLSVAWSLVVNVTILAATLRHDKIALIAHAVLGWTILVVSYALILFLLFPYGFNVALFDSWTMMAHGIVGVALLGLVAIQVGGGMACKIFQNNKSMEIQRLKLMRNLHRATGYFIAIIYKIMTLWAWYNYVVNAFVSLFVWELFWIALFFAVKFGMPKMEKKITDGQTQKFICPNIGHFRDITKVTDKYVIFANYVYDARKLEEDHPGGYKVIELCQGREVDRFIYGMYSVELYPELAAYSHSANSIEIAGYPVAKLVCPPTYEGIDSELCEGKIKFMSCICQKTQIYSIGIIQPNHQMHYLGYSDIRQLGQYYSLTIDGKITRLYTAVNFLNPENLSRLGELMDMEAAQNALRDIEETIRMKEIQMPVLTNKASNKQKLLKHKPKADYLPMMLKVYNDGKLTSALRKQNFLNIGVKFSCPRGKGLELEDTKPGRIILVAGGTGIFPFSDLIDLLFKTQMIEEKHRMSEELLYADPILQKRPFERFKFVLLIAISEPEDLHPIFFGQLVRLSNNSQKIKIVMRVSKNVEAIKNDAGKIEFTRDYFTKRVVTEAQAKDFSRVWICGPPKMNTDTAKILEENGFRRQDYLLV